jgi:hypothetical protein
MLGNVNIRKILENIATHLQSTDANPKFEPIVYHFGAQNSPENPAGLEKIVIGSITQDLRARFGSYDLTHFTPTKLLWGIVNPAYSAENANSSLKNLFSHFIININPQTAEKVEVPVQIVQPKKSKRSTRTKGSTGKVLTEVRSHDYIDLEHVRSRPYVLAGTHVNAVSWNDRDIGIATTISRVHLACGLGEVKVGELPFPFHDKSHRFLDSVNRRSQVPGYDPYSEGNLNDYSWAVVEALSNASNSLEVS